MKIAGLSFIQLSTAVPEGKAYGMTKALASARQSTLVRLTLEDGTVGWGEAWGLPAVNKAYEPFLSSYVLGTNVLDIEHVFDRILCRHYHFGVQGQMMHAISGIDIAAKDAAGKALGVPVCRLIGGKRIDAVHFYASGGYLTETPEKDYAPQIERFAEAGYPAVKIKIGMSPKSDEERVALARKILGDDVEILCDVNTNYRLDTAKECAARIAPYRVGWLEEPLMPQEFGNLARLREASAVPIATGEALYTVFEFQRLAEAGAVDVFQPDLSLCGGFWQGRKIAEIALANHIRMSPHVWGTAVGLAAALHYIASLSGFPHVNHETKPVFLEYDTGHNPLRDDLLRTPIVPEGGRVRVPEGPGLGIEIDEAALERYGDA